jgi:hypothetical protein
MSEKCVVLFGVIGKSEHTRERVISLSCPVGV